MTTYAWPDSRVFRPATSMLQVVDNLQRVNESPLSGYTQTLAMPGARWAWSFTFPAQTVADRDLLEAYLLALSGRANRVQLWDLKRPMPLGDINTSGVTLAASASQFATSVQLAGVRPAGELLYGAGFGADTNADGLSDHLTTYATGSYAGVNYTRVGFSGNAQRVTATTLGGTTTSQVGWRWTANTVLTEGKTYSIAADLYGSAGTSVAIELDCYNASNVFLGRIYNTWAGSGVGYDRRSVSGAAPAGTAYGVLYIYMHSNSAGSPELRADNVTLRESSTAAAFTLATLKGGDWLALPDQLLRCVADATADESGLMTVSVRQMLRNAQTAATAVTLAKPTGLFMRTEAGIALPRQPGPVEPEITCDFVEAFA